MNWELAAEVPLWVPFAAGSIAVAARLAGFLAAWGRVSRFGDPNLLGLRRRPIRECACALLLGAGTTLTVAMLVPDPAVRAKSRLKPTVILFDAEVSGAGEAGFSRRYGLANLLVARVAMLSPQGTLVPVGGAISGGGKASWIAPTRDLEGLLQRGRTILISSLGVQVPNEDMSLAAEIRAIRRRVEFPARICVVTTRGAAESDAAVGEPADGEEVLVLGVREDGAADGYYCRKRSSTGFGEGAGSELTVWLSAGAETDEAATRQPLGRLQVLAVAAFALLLAEWGLRSGGPGNKRRGRGATR